MGYISESTLRESKLVTATHPYKGNEGIGSIFVEVDLPEFSILGKNALQLLVRQVTRQVPHKQPAAGIELLFFSIKGWEIILRSTQFSVHPLLDLILKRRERKNKLIY